MGRITSRSLISNDLFIVGLNPATPTIPITKPERRWDSCRQKKTARHVEATVARGQRVAVVGELDASKLAAVAVAKAWSD